MACSNATLMGMFINGYLITECPKDHYKCKTLG